MGRQEHEQDPEELERRRNVELGIKLIQDNSRDCLVIYSGWDEAFGYHASSTTYALGAIKRLSIMLDEKERREYDIEETTE